MNLNHSVYKIVFDNTNAIYTDSKIEFTYCKALFEGKADAIALGFIFEKLPHLFRIFSGGSYTSKEDYIYFNPSDEFIKGFNAWFKNTYIPSQDKSPKIELNFFDKVLCFDLMNENWVFKATEDVLKSTAINTLFKTGFDFLQLLI